MLRFHASQGAIGLTRKGSLAGHNLTKKKRFAGIYCASLQVETKFSNINSCNISCPRSKTICTYMLVTPAHLEGADFIFGI